MENTPWPFFRLLTMVLLLAACPGLEPAWASQRSEIFRQSRSGAVLLVSVDRGSKSLSFGTGFFISRKGHILTNAHVLTDKARLFVYIPDQGVFPDAKTVTIDQDADLAVLQLPSIHGRALPLFESFAEEGTEALAVGFPRVIDTLQMGLTLHSTVKPVNVSGVAMGRSRTQGRIIPFIQASGVLHAGTSGGPLVHAGSGQVLGMVVHSVPYIGQAKDRQGSMIGSVLLRADMSYAIPATLIRQWLVDRHIPHETTVSRAVGTAPSGSLASLQVDPHILGMSLFLTGHLVQTIANTVNDPEFTELAVNYYEKALEIFPGKQEIARNLALAYKSLHRDQDALKIYEGLLQQSPSDLFLLTETAQTWKFLHHEDKAMAMYEAVLEQDPCYLDALNGLGHLYLVDHEYGKAVQTFRKAVKCAPSSAYASFYLGESMVRSGSVEEAQAVWKGSLERVSIQTLQEKELFTLMRERTLHSPGSLFHTSPVPQKVDNPKSVSQ
jgi:S1-C subfamily serine protease/tetratricopeptide (TPR) repeat protein